ncbi:hypothetical protein ACO1PF_00585 [Alkalibacterium sp. f15]|uniref:hypothetical protein n=1 Tax=Alkalibacterium sp. f15 TaxID=3414029 RepID=UPI003BF7F557
MSDSVQIIIKKYDSTVFKASLPELEGNALIQQLIDREEELAAHDYHGRLNTYYGGSNPND